MKIFGGNGLKAKKNRCQYKSDPFLKRENLKNRMISIKLYKLGQCKVWSLTGTEINEIYLVEFYQGDSICSNL